MDRITIKRSETSFFTELANKINENQETLANYIQQPISLTSFEQQILLKKEHFSLAQRHLIQEVFTEQLSSYFYHQKLKENVRLIGEETTFTITSGHQLNLFGGP